jgi:hypothetical protein
LLAQGDAAAARQGKPGQAGPAESGLNIEQDKWKDFSGYAMDIRRISIWIFMDRQLDTSMDIKGYLIGQVNGYHWIS